MENKLLKATYGSDKTPLKLGELEIPCYVLEDGTRVFSGRGMQKALGSQSKSGEWIQSFIKKIVSSTDISTGEISIIDRISNPIKFKRPDAGGSQSTTNGYEVTLLIDICSLIIDKNRAGEYNEEIILRNADIIIRSVAKVGIIALVDEATGYQYDREKDELQKILKAYISEELLSWQKRFPDIFYKELFRLNGWDFTINGIKKRPSVIGKWTNTLIYKQLPNGVLEELKSKTPKSDVGNKTARYHQYLTLDIGEPNLTAQINQIVTLFQLSDNMKHMWNQFEKLKFRQQGQLEIPFNFDDKGHTIEQIDENSLSDFDKSLKKALNYTPKE